MPSLPDNAQSIKRQALLDQAQALVGIVESAYEQGTAAHEVEKQLLRKVLAMGYQALGLLFSLYGSCDVGEQVELSDGRTVKRLEKQHRRDYLSISVNCLPNAPFMVPEKVKRLTLCRWMCACNCPRVKSRTCCKTGRKRWPAKCRMRRRAAPWSAS